LLLRIDWFVAKTHRPPLHHADQGEQLRWRPCALLGAGQACRFVLGGLDELAECGGRALGQKGNGVCSSCIEGSFFNAKAPGG
jgi:hypothetical protein